MSTKSLSIDKLPEQWCSATLGEVCTKPQYGWTTKASKSGTIKLLRTTDITPGHIDWTHVPFCSKNPDNLDKYLLDDGDIVISRAGSVGVSYLVSNPPKSVFASYLIRFKPKISKRYFAYFLKGPAYWDEISERKLGIAIPNVNATRLKSIKLPVAPLQEQHRIVAKIEELFSKLDAGVAALKKAQALLKRYRASVLKAACEGRLVPIEAELAGEEGRAYEPAEALLDRILEERRATWEGAELAKMVRKGKVPKNDKWMAKYKEPAAPDTSDLHELPEGWVWATVEQLASPKPRSIQSGPFGSNLRHSEFQETGILVVGIDNVQDCSFSMGAEHRISEEKFSELIKYKARPLDVLITVMATVGRCAVVPFDLEPAIITKHVYRITCDQNIIRPHYLQYALAGGVAVRNQMFGQVRGQTRPGINGGILRKLAIPVPPASEQDRIIVQIQTIESLIENAFSEIEKNLEIARAMRQSILKQAFQGKLVPQDPNDEPASVLLERIKA